jgi:pyridoxine 4-dehydrogenase
VRSPTDVCIATKLAPYPWRIGRGSIKEALGASAKRLQRDVVEVGQLHWAPPLGWQEEEYWAGLAELYTR